MAGDNSHSGLSKVDLWLSKPNSEFAIAELLLFKNQILPLQEAHGMVGNARHMYLGVIPWLLLSHAVWLL